MIKRVKEALTEVGQRSRLLTLTGAVFGSGTVGTGAYQGLKDTVQVDVDGQEQIVQTYADTVEDALAEAGIKLTAADVVEPGKDTAIKDGMNIEIHTAKNVTIDVDGVQTQVTSTTATVNDLLVEQGIVVTDSDIVTPAKNTTLEDNGTVTVQKAVPVTFNNGGTVVNAVTTEKTVGEFLTANNVKVEGLDRVVPAAETAITPNMQISVVRVAKATKQVQATVPFKVVQKNDPTLAQGQTKVAQEGKNGMSNQTVEVTTENGQEVGKTVVSETVVTPSTDKIVLVGTKQETMSGYTVAKTFTVKSTAYTPAESVRGITATGINIKKNPNMKLIAVDPKVIPLGSKVWVEGYGIAIAADTGGAIKGNKIDVLMPSVNNALNWGRRTVTVKVLK